MEFNILKLAFLLGYLSLLVCVVSGIPFLTALFRSVLVTVIFSLLGFFVRLYLLRLVSSVERHTIAEYERSADAGSGTAGAGHEMAASENLEHETPVSIESEQE